MGNRKKITIVGAGHVGATAAHWASIKKLGDVVLVDIVEGVPQGKALDLMQAAPIEGVDFSVVGTQDYEKTANSDLVIVTAGSPRKPGMSRDDLVEINTKIVKSVVSEIKKYSPDCVLMIVSNPLDAMVHVAKKTSGFPSHRVLGMAGELDTGRFRCFLAEALDCSVRDVFAFVLGGHGDQMVPVPRYSTMAGIPISNFLSKDEIEAIVDRTRKGGAEIVGLLKTGSAFYAPSAAAIEMAESILFDTKRIFPACVYLNGEYGYKDLFLGVPTKLGKKGVEKIIELKLEPDEKEALDKSASAVRELMAKAEEFLQ